MKKQVLLIYAFCTLLVAQYSAQAQTTVTFSFTGSAQTWVVPSGVTSLQVTAKGAKGGNGNHVNNPNSPGGQGGIVSATLAVTAGTTLYIYVGDQGKSGQFAASDAGATGAFNGGGTIFGYTFGGTGNGGGGGATDIRIGSNALSNRVLVAGGGGGGVIRTDQRAGGAGGGLIGGAGQGGTVAGQGGTQSAGGAGGLGALFGSANSGGLGIGGGGGSGGGGGGFYGGGSGYFDDFSFPSESGGGGGSSYTDPTLCTNVAHTQGGNNGDGELTIIYSAVLPVELLDFKGTPSVSGNLLTWQTASEINNKGFQVERSPQPPTGASQTWETLGFKTANDKAGTYQFTDDAPHSTSYYRLRQIDNDGKETLSKVISIATKGNSTLKVYPNPVSNTLTIETDFALAPNEANRNYQIINLLGQTLLRGTATTQNIDVSALPQGSYVLKVGSEQVKFVKQ